MSNVADGELSWKEWRVMGMYVGGDGKYMRMFDNEIYIWYEVTEKGFVGVEDDDLIDSLEALFENSGMEEA